MLPVRKAIVNVLKGVDGKKQTDILEDLREVNCVSAIENFSTYEKNIELLLELMTNEGFLQFTRDGKNTRIYTLSPEYDKLEVEKRVNETSYEEAILEVMRIWKKPQNLKTIFEEIQRRETEGFFKVIRKKYERPISNVAVRSHLGNLIRLSLVTKKSDSGPSGIRVTFELNECILRTNVDPTHRAYIQSFEMSSGCESSSLKTIEESEKERMLFNDNIESLEVGSKEN